MHQLRNQQRNQLQNQLLKLASNAADDYYANQAYAMQQAPQAPVGSMANKMGLGAAALGTAGGAYRSKRRNKTLKKGLITSLGTGALWGLGGAMAGSFVKDDL